MSRMITVLVVLGLLLAGCSGDPTASEEYENVALELAEFQQQLADAIEERDALAAAGGESSDRYEKALANQESVEDILHNPESYGTEQQVVELLATYATADAVMEDAVFGAVPIQNAWYYTLYGGTMDAEIDIYYRWLSEDGSQGGALWIWHGTNQVGNAFELAGIALDDYDENGLIAHEYVVYPYSDDYVSEAIVGDGTGQRSEESQSSQEAASDPWGLDAVTDPTTQDEVNAIFLAMPDEIDDMTAYRDDPDHVGYVEYRGDGSYAQVAWDDVGEDRSTTIQQLESIAQMDQFTELDSSLDSGNPTVWLHGIVVTEDDEQALLWGDPSDGWLFVFNADSVEHLDALVAAFISAATGD